MKERFTVDRNLGKLAKWLRILGYDAVYDRANADREFLRRAAEEGRIALARRRDLARLTHPGCLVIVKADRVEVQIREILEVLALEPDPARRMTRCLNCNASLDEVPKETVEGMVPDYIYSESYRFLRCNFCGRIFWPGTHHRRVEEYLRTRIPARRP